MALRKRGKSWHIRFRPFKGCQEIGLATNSTTKLDAAHIERQILTACKSRDFSFLDPSARAACLTMFHNQGWEVPPDLANDRPEPQEDLTLWKASELFIKYPEIASRPNNWRYDYAIAHLIAKLGKERPLKSIRVPDLKAYRLERLNNEEAAPATVNWELATLSRLFSVMIELDLVVDNPVRMMKRLSTKSGERQVYLSLHDVHLIADQCPEWYQLVIWTAYYTGMRRGEIASLTRKRINLKTRIIYLGPDHVKEGDWKRVPIHRELVPYLKEALRLPSLISDKVFLVRDGQGIRALGKDTLKNPWPRACKALEGAELLEKPFPRFHDLRHTWKTNARRSGMDPEIRESILGHWFREKSVTERYGRISNEELVRAIDSMTFDHGETEILVARQDKDDRADKTRTNEPEKQKGQVTA